MVLLSPMCQGLRIALAFSLFSFPTSLLALSSSPQPSSSDTTSTNNNTSKSKWSRRTERKRQKTGNLLSLIPPPPQLNTWDCPTPVLRAPEIDWESCSPDLDPQQGGKLKPGSLRAIRKRRAIEAFCYISEHILKATKGGTILDAGSGAGNLAIPLAGLLPRNLDATVAALDVNPIALQRLQQRSPEIQTICTDLAFTDKIDLKAYGVQLVVSLHACGAATDMAIRLATRNNLPFCMSPCCTAKAVKGRISTTKVMNRINMMEPSASSYRSGAPKDIAYPRSQWLHHAINNIKADQSSSTTTVEQDEEKNLRLYEMLAMVADVGLGPQTPKEQVLHQQRSKLIVEWDRLMEICEDYPNYQVAMFHINKDPLEQGYDYGKREIFVGIPNEIGVGIDKLL